MGSTPFGACEGGKASPASPAFHFLIKLPALDTPVSFGFDLVKDTLFTKPIFKG